MKQQIKVALFLFFIMNCGKYSGQFNQKNTIRKADSLLNSYVKKNAPGMAVGIIKEGKVIYKKIYGQANLENQTPITDSTAFNIASVSKQFTAFIALQAVKEGKLSLDDDIRIYLPELKHLSYPVTIRQLANHTHGLPDFTGIKRLQGFGDEFRVTNSQAVQTILGIKSFNFRPGEQYQYNNTGFMLLAEILHRVYKKDFGELLRKYIFTPLGMHHTMAIDDPEKIIPNKADSYLQQGDTVLKYPIGQMEYGSSNIYMTLNDFCIWAADFQKSATDNHDFYTVMQENTILNNGRSIEYGLGLQTGTYKGLHLVFHGGGTAGYGSYILHIPNQQFSVVLLANKRGTEGYQMVYKLVDLFLGDKETVVKPKKTAYTASELKGFEGIYERIPGSYFDVSVKENNLYLKTYKQEEGELLEPVGDNRFSIPSVATASLVFNKDSAFFKIADFTFPMKKIRMNPPKMDLKDLKKLEGFYRNEEFNTMYQLVTENHHLVAKHSVNPDILLFPLSSTSFYSSKSYFGQLDFQWTPSGTVSGFTVSGFNMANIEFKKIK